MDHSSAAFFVRNIAQSVDRDKYPETVALTESYVEFFNANGEIPEPPEETASRLMDLDDTEIMPPEVTEFVILALSDAIDQGNYDSALDLGRLYYVGRSGEKDYKKAIYYYEIASAHGNIQATCDLGYCYYYGRSVEVDYEKAFGYFIKGALTGHLNSLYKIGDMYKFGYYVEQDPVEAFRIYDHAIKLMNEEDPISESVSADLFMRIADAFFEGSGVDQDLRIAFRYYQMAESGFIDRYMDGDYMIKGNMDKCLQRQKDIREMIDMPGYEWNIK